MKIEIDDSLEAVGPDAWDAVHAGSRLRAPFLAWTWQREWVGVFAEGRRLELRRVVDAAGRLVALLPLVEIGPQRFMLAGGADVSDYLDLVAVAGREEEAWTALLESRAAEPVVKIVRFLVYRISCHQLARMRSMRPPRSVRSKLWPP